MAGTRLAAHTSFLVFSLISVLIAWRLGVVRRAPLPINAMLGLRDNSQVPLLVAVELVLLRDAGDCAACASILDAIQNDPPLSRDVFRIAQQQDQRDSSVTVDESTAEKSEHISTSTSLFEIGEVNLRVMHAAHGLGWATKTEPPTSNPEAWDKWLQNIVESEMTRESASAHDRSSSPRYTFFMGCLGGGARGELPTFIMGKRRHGYLGLGCGCACDNSNDNGDSFSDSVENILNAGDSEEKAKSRSPLGLGRRQTEASSARAVLEMLASTVVTYVLRSPVSPGDVHVRPGQAYRLNFSLMSEDPSVRRCTWDFSAASRRYLRPLLQKLQPVASFSIQSQEIHYARLASGPPRWISSRKIWYYSPADLKGFLGTNDFSMLDVDAAWGPGERRTGRGNVTSGIAAQSQVAINFMIFCPSTAHSPLVFMNEWAGAESRQKPAAEAYEVPGFGGVSVINVDEASTSDNPDSIDSLMPGRLRQALGAHVVQLRRIIGLPRLTDRPSEMPWPLALPAAGTERNQDVCALSCQGAGAATPGRIPVTFLTSPLDGVTDWEVDAVIRSGLLRNRAAAAETLRSLAELVESRPEMEVSAKIAQDVKTAISALAMADAAVSNEARGLRGGGGSGSALDRESANEAMHWTREALRFAESAYFDPTMVPQLYFPEDYLMAVYLPFLGPLALPLLWGFIQELSRFRRKRRAKRAKEMKGEDRGDPAAGVEPMEER